MAACDKAVFRVPVTDVYGATAIIRRYSDLAEAFIDLALARNDAVLAEVAPARVSFLQTPLGADYEFVGPEITDERWFGTGIGIAVRKGDNARREALTTHWQRSEPTAAIKE
jgi:arginine/ornithine transport system substrate-binding protein